jgi:hypothetical protein
MPLAAPHVEQLTIGGLVTSDAVARAVQRAVKKATSGNGKRKGESAQERFGFDCQQLRLPTVTAQFELVKTLQEPRKDRRPVPRVWRFDYAFVEQQVIVEIDGGVWRPGGGAHSHPVDITRNMTKRNDAALAGFVLLSFTPAEVFAGHAVEFTMRVLVSRGWAP